MDRFSQVAAQLQSLRPSDSDPNGSSPNRMHTSSSPATDAADAEVRKDDAGIAIRSKKRKLPSDWDDGPTSDSNGNGNGNGDGDGPGDTYMPRIKDEEMTEASTPNSPASVAAFIKAEETPDTTTTAPQIPNPTRPTTTIYDITHPFRTLEIPPNYPFRTTPLGYPFFPPRPHPPRFTLSSHPNFPDPRITDFIEHFTEIYEEIGDGPDGLEEGMFKLRLACHMRGLVTYGVMETLVVRLVERGMRDAARGWTEVRDGVGRVRVVEAPMLPMPGWRFASDAYYDTEDEEEKKKKKKEEEEEEEEEKDEDEDEDEDEEGEKSGRLEEGLFMYGGVEEF